MGTLYIRKTLVQKSVHTQEVTVADPTKIRPIRVPDDLWTAYGQICETLDTTRTEDLLNHMRDRIREHGTPEQLELLAKADAELAERRARKGGRPPAARSTS